MFYSSDKIYNEISPEDIKDFLIYKRLSPSLNQKLKMITEQEPTLTKLEALEILMDHLDSRS